MKRIISLVLMLALAVSLCACGQKEDEPLTWQEQYDLGLHYLEEGNYDEAILAFQAAIEIDPKQAEAYIALAEVYVEQGDAEKAAEILDQAVAEIGQTDELLEAKAALTPSESQPTPEPTPEQADPYTKRKDNGDGSYWIFEYDADGQLIKEVRYCADGTVEYQGIYEYDSTTWLRHTQYSADGTVQVVLEYGADGNCVKEAHYFADETLNHCWINEYDAAGNRVRQTGYDSDGTVEQIHEYDANGNKVRTTYYNPDGGVSHVIDH